MVVRYLTSAEKLELYRRAQRLRGIAPDPVQGNVSVVEMDELIQPSFVKNAERASLPPGQKFWLLNEAPASRPWAEWYDQLPPDLCQRISPHNFEKLGKFVEQRLRGYQNEI
jgi:hypothetical protein